MNGTGKAFAHSDNAKYVTFARLRTIQKASLLFVFANSAVFFFFDLPDRAATALCWLSIAASLCGVVSIAAYHLIGGNLRTPTANHKTS